MFSFRFIHTENAATVSPYPEHPNDRRLKIARVIHLSNTNNQVDQWNANKADDNKKFVNIPSITKEYWDVNQANKTIKEQNKIVYTITPMAIDWSWEKTTNSN